MKFNVQNLPLYAIHRIFLASYLELNRQMDYQVLQKKQTSNKKKNYLVTSNKNLYEIVSNNYKTKTYTIQWTLFTRFPTVTIRHFELNLIV